MNATAIFKALGDSSRLALMRELFNGPLCAEELCERLKLAPSTISHHSGKLVDAGLVTVTREHQSAVYEVSGAMLERRLRDLILSEGRETEVIDGRREAYRRKVLSNFIEFGRLKTIPAQRKKRLIILEQIVGEFEEGRRYTEAEVSETLRNWHDDYCFLRRELIVERLMFRRDGIYCREEF